MSAVNPRDFETPTRPSLIALAGRDVRVACGLEPVFELRKLSIIGHRLEPLVVDASGHVRLDGKALRIMDWADREKIDLANIDEGLRLLRARSEAQRKILVVVPVAFSTLASARSRTKATTDLSRAASGLGMKLLYEVRELAGVPVHRIVEIMSMLKPHCMAVVGHVGSDHHAIRTLRQCGFSGACITYDGLTRDEEALQNYLTLMTAAAREAAGACMIQGLNNLHQVAVARLAGVSHASVKTSALMATG